MTSSLVTAMPAGETVNGNDWRSVAMIELVNPDTNAKSSCTAVILSESTLVTTASCVYYKEALKLATKVKACIGNKKPFTQQNEGCFDISEIYIHPQFVNNLDNPGAVNLAYLTLNNPLPLKRLAVKPAQPMTPELFADIAQQATVGAVTWVGFDSSSLTTNARGVKRVKSIESLEYQFYDQQLTSESSKALVGRQYQGLANFLKHDGNWYFLGLVSSAKPDNIISFYPEINPCEENPVIVRYPKPLVYASSKITAYPVAACGMPGFFKQQGFTIASCERYISAELAIERQLNKANKVAQRQQAVAQLALQDSQAGSTDSIRYLYLAANSGDQQAALELAKIMIDGQLMTENLKAAENLLTMLVDAKQPKAQYLMAKLLTKKWPQPSVEQQKQIYDLTLAAAEQGIIDAQYQLGRLHQSGIGVAKSEANAYNWLARAAQQGHGEAQFQLATQLGDGRGVRAHYEASRFWLRQAAANGHLEAQNYLGMLKPVARQN